VRGARTALAVALATTLLLSTSTRDARASDEKGRTSSLSWLRMPGSDSCIATQALARSVEERLGRRVFVSAAEADVSVEGRIEKRTGANGGWHSVITIRDGKGALLGTRELDRNGASCAAMSDPLALVIAVMIDPEAKLSSSPPPLPPPAAPPVAAPPAAPTPAPAPAPAPAPVDLPEPHTNKKEPWRFQGDAVTTISAGLTPAIAPGGTIAGALFLPNGIPLGLRGYASLFLPTTALREGASASFDLFYVGGSVCPTLRRPAFVGMLCFGGQLGVVRSHPETQGRAQEKTLGLWNGVSEARISVPLVAPVALTAGVSAVLPLLRPTFEYTRPDGSSANLHKVSSFAMAADAGIGFFFP
jgi:hypothetical protein